MGKEEVWRLVMFCLYCGSNLPDDALFCNSCGKQQKALANTSMPGAIMPPNPPLNLPTITGQPFPGNVPTVQGTPQVRGVPGVRGTPSAPFHAPPGNAASAPFPSSGAPPMPPHAPSPAYPVNPSYTYERHIESGHVKQHPPHVQHHKTERPDTEPEPTPAKQHHSRHHEQSGMQHTGLKTTGHLSRRAVVLGLAGTTALVVAGGGIVWLNHTKSPQAPATSPTPSLSSLGTLLYTYHNDAVVQAVAWSPDGQRVLSGGYSAVVNAPTPYPRSWNAFTGSNMVIYRAGQQTYGSDSVAWSPNGKYILTGDATDNYYVEVWDAATGKQILTYAHNTGLNYGAVPAVAWSPDSHYFASGGEDEKVQVWDITLQSHIFTYQGHTGSIYGIAWAPDGKRIASASGQSIYTQNRSDNTVQVWNPTDGGNVYIYRGHAGDVYTVAYSPDGKRIASGSGDKTIQVWDATNGGNVYTYKGHSGEVYAAAYSPDGKRIASGGSDATVRIWDATTGTTLYTYRGHSDKVYAVAWSPDGKHIASGGKDKTVQVWQAS